MVARSGRSRRTPSVGDVNLPVLAGVASTVIFVLSTLPTLFWYLRYTQSPISRDRREMHHSPDADDVLAA